MSHMIAMEKRGAPDGMTGDLIGFQPPLDPHEATVVQDAVEAFFEADPKHKVFLGTTALTTVTPEEGEPFSVLRAYPTQLHDPRAEHVGRELAGKLYVHIAQALLADGVEAIDFRSARYAQESLSADNTLFGGRMSVWYKDLGNQPTVAAN